EFDLHAEPFRNSVFLEPHVILPRLDQENPMMTTDLNMATEVTGYQRFLFVTLPERAVNAELCEALDRLGRDMENMHEVAGLPSEDAWQAGRFQLLRAEPAFSSERDIHQPAISSARVLIRLEGAR